MTRQSAKSDADTVKREMKDAVDKVVEDKKKEPIGDGSVDVSSIRPPG